MVSKILVASRKLKGLMAEHDVTVRQLSRKMGISENSLMLKINGKRDWWFWEMLAVTKYFGFSEVREVFPEIYSHILKTG